MISDLINLVSKQELKLMDCKDELKDILDQVMELDQSEINRGRVGEHQEIIDDLKGIIHKIQELENEDTHFILNCNQIELNRRSEKKKLKIN